MRTSRSFSDTGTSSQGKDGTKRKSDRTKSPHLYSIFLDPSKIGKIFKSVSFVFDLKVLVPDYIVDGLLVMKRHYGGGFIYRELVLVEDLPDERVDGGWCIKYGKQDMIPGKPREDAETDPLIKGKPNSGLAFDIPIEHNVCTCLRGTLRIEARQWA
ncbi:MAG: hypothetical protein MRJ67_05805 [Nitrospirales bacterium]|nr:hypothetical protein [Nitrospirales bacterium]